MKAFVTGATGFLGSHLVDRLLEEGAEVHVLVRKSSNLRWLLGKKVHYHYGDVVGDLKGLEKGLKGADAVFHVAGVVRAPQAKTYYEVNTQGTANLLAACLKANPGVKRIVLVSSVAAHGPSLDDHPATEEDECHPITEYGKSKRDAELISLRYSDRLPIAIIRPPAIYGPRDEQTPFFFKMVRQGVVLLPGWGPSRNSPCHVQDVATVLLLAARNPKAAGEIFFVSEDRSYTWSEMADIAAEVVQRNIVKIPVPRAVLFTVCGVAELVTRLTGRTFSLNLAYAKNFTQPNWTVDNSKAKKILGFQPAFPLRKGIQETYSWYEKEGWF
jgi:nucleoside-diphosphate-sugar epimerase